MRKARTARSTFLSLGWAEKGSRWPRFVGLRLAIGRPASLWSGPRLALTRRRGPLVGAGHLDTVSAAAGEGPLYPSARGRGVQHAAPPLCRRPPPDPEACFLFC